jgi:hypothetical protein
MVDGSAFEDHFVVGVLQSQFANIDCIMTGLLQKSSERWRKRVVDQEPHSPAASRDPLELHVASVARRQLICERPRSGSYVRHESVSPEQRVHV